MDGPVLRQLAVFSLLSGADSNVPSVKPLQDTSKGVLPS